jgi:hypothetical protein
MHMKYVLFCLPVFLVKSIIILLLSLLACELFLNFVSKKDNFNETDIPYVVDRDLGWKNKSGTFTFNRYGDGKLIIENYDSFGGRISPNRKENLNTGVLIGGSFIHGFAINDDETIASKLNEKVAPINFKNLGVSGYSTYQSLILLKEYIKSNSPPKIIVYGFNVHHEYRNYGSFLQRVGISMCNQSDHETLSLPYCRLDSAENLKCIKNQPTPLISILKIFKNLMASLSRISFISEKLIDKNEAQIITKKIIQEIKEEADSIGAVFILFILRADEHESNKYITFANENEFYVIDCQHPLQHLPEYLLPEGYHPNEEVVQYWGECLGSYINDKVRIGLP